METLSKDTQEVIGLDLEKNPRYVRDFGSGVSFYYPFAKYAGWEGMLGQDTYAFTMLAEKLGSTFEELKARLDAGEIITLPE